MSAPDARRRAEETARIDLIHVIEWLEHGHPMACFPLFEGDGQKARDKAQRLRALLAATTPGPEAASEEVREAAERFGARLLAEWWENDCADLDGSSVQEIAEETGLWHQVEHHAPGVECEWCNNEEPCGELTEAGLVALASRGSSL